MTRPLAFPSFVTGPKDDLAAPDIYKLVDGTPINKIVPFQAVDPLKEKGMNLLAGAKGMLGDIKKGMTLANNLKNINLKGDPLAQLANGNRALGMITKALPPGMSDLAKGLGTYATGVQAGMKQAQGYIAKINGIKQTLKNGTDLAKISVIGNMMNSVSCDTSVFGAEDRRATAGAYAGVIGTAMDFGLQGAFGAVLKCEGNVGILNQVAAACLPGTIQMSDLTSLGDMANKLQPGTIKGLNPSVIGDFNRMFSLPPGTSTSDYSSIYSSATSTFGSIDPNWNAADFGGERIGSLTCVMGASSDFQNVMAGSIMSNPNATDDDHVMLAALGESPTNVHQELQTQFPAMTSLTANKPPIATLDPATLSSVTNMQTNAPLPMLDSLNVTPSVTASNPPPPAKPVRKTATGLSTTMVWTPSHQDIFDDVAERFKLDYKDPQLKSYGWIQQQWMNRKITQEERYTLEMAP